MVKKKSSENAETTEESEKLVSTLSFIPKRKSSAKVETISGPKVSEIKPSKFIQFKARIYAFLFKNQLKIWKYIESLGMATMIYFILLLVFKPSLLVWLSALGLYFLKEEFVADIKSIKRA